MQASVKTRSSIRSRVSKPTSSATHTSISSNHTKGLFKSSKDDKRRIKHSSLISRIEKANQESRKRRRPSKKLIANLESIADALPTLSNEQAIQPVDRNGRIRHKSLKSKPGAMKKKEKLEQMERERFSRNMAQMAELHSEEISSSFQAAVSNTSAGIVSSTRWAALRGFIQQTMDRDPNDRTKNPTRM